MSTKLLLLLYVTRGNVVVPASGRLMLPQRHNWQCEYKQREKPLHVPKVPRPVWSKNAYWLPDRNKFQGPCWLPWIYSLSARFFELCFSPSCRILVGLYTSQAVFVTDHLGTWLFPPTVLFHMFCYSLLNFTPVSRSSHSALCFSP